MVRITNGKLHLLTTRGSFEQHYKPLGFTEETVSQARGTTERQVIQGEAEKQLSEEISQSKTDTEEESSEPDSEEDVDLSEIPLEDMTFAQLYEYATELGVTYHGNSPAKMRAAIREALANKD